MTTTLVVTGANGLANLGETVLATEARPGSALISSRATDSPREYVASTGGSA
jgi:hypothetical protein